MEFSHDVVRHEVELKYIHEELAELRAEVKNISAILNRAQGSWKVLVAVGGIASGLTVAAAKAVGWLAPH